MCDMANCCTSMPLNDHHIDDDDDDDDDDDERMVNEHDDAMMTMVIFTLRPWLQLRFDFDSTAFRQQFDSHSTAILLRYDHSTTYVTTVGLYLYTGCCTAT